MADLGLYGTTPAPTFSLGSRAVTALAGHVNLSVTGVVMSAIPPVHVRIGDGNAGVRLGGDNRCGQGVPVVGVVLQHA